MAAHRFYQVHLDEIFGFLGTGIDNLVLRFPPADHTQRAWRLAAVQELARELAPLRVNAVASDEEKAIAAAVAYLETAPGVTGQYLPLDGNGAEEVLCPDK
jgi:hypothetical protein